MTLPSADVPKEPSDLSNEDDLRLYIRWLHRAMVTNYQRLGAGVVPESGIILWPAVLTDLPPGWALCDSVANFPGPDLSAGFTADFVYIQRMT